MANSFSSKIGSIGGFTGHINNSIPGMNPMSASQLEEIDKPEASFKGVMSGLASNLNQELNAPDKLMKDAMTGNNGVDIHDVMTAMAKAEINVNVATQVTTKVIQAYDKIMQISV